MLAKKVTKKCQVGPVIDIFPKSQSVPALGLSPGRQENDSQRKRHVLLRQVGEEKRVTTIPFS